MGLRDARDDPTAVSPVLAVLVLVAITVVMAVVIFVLATDMGKPPERAPHVAFQPDDGAVRVIHTPQGTAWSDVVASGTCSSLELRRASGEDLPWAVPGPGPPVPIQGGDELVGCDGETLRLRHQPSNTVLPGADWTL